MATVIVIRVSYDRVIRVALVVIRVSLELKRVIETNLIRVSYCCISYLMQNTFGIKMTWPSKVEAKQKHLGCKTR